MQKVSLIALLAVLLLSCGNPAGRERDEQVPVGEPGFPESYTVVGEDFSPEAILEVPAMRDRYNAMAVGDTVAVKLRAAVKSVCKNKGCWMKLDMNDGNETMVKFKDYGFFVPKDIEQREVVVNGLAYVSEMSVEDQRHFAEDGGATPAEIAAIISPKKTYSFLAEGVVIENRIEKRDH